MAISFVGGTTGTGTGASYSVSLSGTLTGGSGSSPLAGDLIVVLAGHGNSATSAPAVSGNTSSTYCSAHAALDSADTWRTEYGTFYQFAGTTPDTSLTITRTNNVTHGGATVVLVFRGAGVIKPTTATGINGAAVNAPSVTPTVAGSWIVAGGTGTFAAADTAGMTAISNLTAVQTAYGNGSTADACTIAGYLNNWTSGAFDPAAGTGGNLANASSSWAAVSLVIEPKRALLSASFQDDFSSGSINGTRWATFNDANATSTVVSQQLQQTLTSSAVGFALIVANTGQFFSLTGDRTYIRVVQAIGLTAAGTGGETKFQIWDEPDLNSNANIVIRSDGVLEWNYFNTGTYSFVGSTTYSSSTHAWLGFRADGTTLYFDAAPSTASNPPSSGDWTNLGSVPRSTALVDPERAGLAIFAGQFTSIGTPTQPAIWDGVNIATVSGTSVALTGNSATSARGTLGTLLANTLTGQSVTASRGTLFAGLFAALTGNSATVANGTLGVTATRALTGQSVTVSKGSPSLVIPRVGFGVNVHDGGINTGENRVIADLLFYRGLNKRVRFDLFWDQAQTNTRELASMIIAQGGSVCGSLQIAYQFDWTTYGTNLTTVYNSAKSQTYTFVNANKDIFQDIELLNETQLRDEMPWDPFSAAGTHTYSTSTEFQRLAACLKGMSDAVTQVKAESGLPMRVILGFLGRDYDFLTYMVAQGLYWDVTGFHVYPHFGDTVLTTDTYYGTGGVFQQLNAFGKPVTINEINSGEIYDVGYENLAGQPITETGFSSVAKHLRDITNQTKCTLETITCYELWDEPWNTGSEAMFGLMYRNGSAPYALGAQKISMLLFAAFAGGYLTSAERTAITTTRALMTGSEIDGLQTTWAATPTGQSATTARGTLFAGKSSTLTGQALTMSLGTMPATDVLALVGQALTTARGTMTNAQVVSLTGQAVTVAKGTITARFTIGLTGTGVTISLGDLTIPNTVFVALTGMSIQTYLSLMRVPWTLTDTTTAEVVWTITPT